MDNLKLHKCQSVQDYISEHYKNKKEFAEAQGCDASQPVRWVKLKYIVVDDVLYSPRKRLINNE